jgi:hypothetical protein
VEGEGPGPQAGSAGPPEPPPEVRQRERFGLLLVALTASFIVEGIAEPGDLSRAVVTALLGGTLLLSFWSAQMPARRLRLAAAIVGLVVVGVVIALVTGSGSAIIGGVGIANGLLVALAPPSIVAGVVRTLRAHRQVTVEVALGALCLYLLAGLLFAFLYGAIDSLGGHPFFAGGQDATAPRAVYFSFTTLTTVGYGDLTARTNLGHTLCVTEALIGQIYLVTVVAVVMGNLVPRRAPRA